MSRGQFLVLAVLMSIVGNASARDLEDCNKPELTQPESADCLHEVMTEAEGELARTVAAAEKAARELDSLTSQPDAAAALHVANAAFTVYREAACRSVGAFYASGSGAGHAITRCYIELIKRRIDDLRLAAGLPSP